MTKWLDRLVFAGLVLAMIGVLLIIAAPVFAQTSHGFEFSWTDPTEREDGEPFNPATEIAKYRAECTRTGSWDDAAFVEFERSETAGTGNDRGFAWVNAVQQGGWYDCRLMVTDTSDLSSKWSESLRVRRLARPKPVEW